MTTMSVESNAARTSGEKGREYCELAELRWAGREPPRAMEGACGRARARAPGEDVWIVWCHACEINGGATRRSIAIEMNHKPLRAGGIGYEWRT